MSTHINCAGEDEDEEAVPIVVSFYAYRNATLTYSTGREERIEGDKAVALFRSVAAAVAEAKSGTPRIVGWTAGDEHVLFRSGEPREEGAPTGTKSKP